MDFLTDRKHTLPRKWANSELRKFANLFEGDIANISGWQDQDKQGSRYKEYFTKASSYTITNFKSEARGFQNQDGEIYLDLEEPLPDNLKGRFDTVFNHTTLEHIYKAQEAFTNICEMAKDTVIITVPFLQPYHAEYGDYWRFSPLALKRMFEDNGLTLLYLSFNNHKQCSVYIFAIATKNPDKWKDKFDYKFSVVDPEAWGPEPYIGFRALPNWGHIIDCALKYPAKLLRGKKDKA